MSDPTLDFLAQLERAHRGDADRPAIRAAGPYKAGEITRLNKSWQPDHYSGEGAISDAWDLLTRRVRDLQRNDPTIIALRRALLDHVVASGIRTAANVLIDGEFDEFCFQADELFDHWAENEADVAGRLAWPEMQRQCFGEMLDTGEALILECSDADRDRSCPLCYQVLEAEQLDTTKDQPATGTQNAIKRGVEVNRFGRPIAYYLFDAHPSDPYWEQSADSTRIPADRVIHLVTPGRPSSTRGISLYNSIVQSSRDMDNYISSELTSATIGSLLTIVHKTSRPGAGLGFSGDGSTDSDGEDEHGNPLITLGRGIVCQVPHEDEIESIATNRPNSTAEPFLRLLMTLLAMGGGISRYRLTRDYSGTTYISARAGHLDDRASFVPLQGAIGRQLVLPVRHRWTAITAALGGFASLSARQFTRQRRRWQAVLLQPPGYEQLDPVKETDAALARVDGGLSTLEEECSLRGRNWRRVLLQRRREIRFAEELEVPLGTRSATPAQPDDEREEEEEEQEQPAEN